MTSPARPRWIPTSFQQARDDIDNRPPSESHYLEFKRELMRTESIRKSVASLANDGGTVIYGIDEDKNTRVATKINPVRLDGATERIQQIALTLDPVLVIEEPLALADPASPEYGIIVVNVPASPMAPHQNDGKYYMRAGTVTETMPDAQVERLIKQRNAAGKPALDMFPKDEGISVPSTSLSMWVAATPRPVRDEHLLGEVLAGNQNAKSWIRQRLEAVDSVLDHQIDNSGAVTAIQTPRLAARFQLGDLSRRSGKVRLRVESEGWLRSYANIQEADPRVHLLEISESGAVGLFANYLSTRRIPEGERPPRNFLWRDAAGLAYAVALLSKELAENVGYQADLDVALRIVGFEGCYPEEPADDFEGSRSSMHIAERDPINDQDYGEQTTWTHAEFNTGSLEPMHRLLGPLLRSMGLGNVLQR